MRAPMVHLRSLSRSAAAALLLAAPITAVNCLRLCLYVPPGFERGLKVFLPPSALEQLTSRDDVVFPMTFGT